MSKKQKKASIWFAIMALIIIPSSSLRLAFKGPILDTTLSKLGGMGHYKELVIWGTIISSFFALSVLYFISFFNLKKKRTKVFLLISCILLELTVLVPFMPSVFPFLAKLHNLFAFSGIILLMITMYFFVISLSDINKVVYKRTLTTLNVIVVLSSLILLLLGISSFFEITMVILTSIMLYTTNRLLNKTSDKSSEDTTE